LVNVSFETIPSASLNLVELVPPLQAAAAHSRVFDKKAIKVEERVNVGSASDRNWSRESCRALRSKGSAYLAEDGRERERSFRQLE
jgi:hypothetical protein